MFAAETVAACASAVAALASAYIAYVQYTVSRESVRESLFEQRFQIFHAYQRLIISAASTSNADPGKLFEAVTAARATATFLLDQSALDYLDELYKRGFALIQFDRLWPTPGMYLSSEQKAETFSRHRQEAEYFGKEIEVLVKWFGPVLRPKSSVTKNS